MAVDINLNMYNGSRHLGCIHLYFGRALQATSWSGWDWVEGNGMKVDGPWVLDDKNAEHGTAVSREQIIEWIENGYLSRSPRGDDTSSDFIRAYPKSTSFKLWFLDWS